MAMGDHSFSLEGTRGTIYSGSRPVAALQHYTVTALPERRLQVVADLFTTDPVYWPFRDPNEPLIAELNMIRSTMRVRLTLNSENPLAGDGVREEDIPDANKAGGDFW